MSVIDNRSYSSRTRRVSLRFFLIHELVKSGKITLRRVPTGAMLADGGDGHPDGDGAYDKLGPEGAVYAVAGSSGRLGGGSLDHPAMVVSLARLGSMVLDVDGLRLDGVFLTEAGELLDRFVLVKTAEIFTDGFESGNTAAWNQTVPAAR